ncbi:MAG: helix-turn-helix transcriptional regulator [Lachnospiraceae bacterium]|nr:helix-turn-helix transcriptional regulator [Lachnospiraceae bacterium]
MSDEEYKKIFSTNLVYYLKINQKTQADLYKYIGVSSATVSDWCNGKKMPRMDKIQSICNWLKIEKSDLLERHTEKSNSYYLNKETSMMAQSIFENKELRMLFDAAQDASPEDLQTVHSMLLALKRKEQGKID